MAVLTEEKWINTIKHQQTSLKLFSILFPIGQCPRIRQIHLHEVGLSIFGRAATAQTVMPPTQNALGFSNPKFDLFHRKQTGIHIMANVIIASGSYARPNSEYLFPPGN